jgi:hypothetical protein
MMWFDNSDLIKLGEIEFPESQVMNTYESHKFLFRFQDNEQYQCLYTVKSTDDTVIIYFDENGGLSLQSTTDLEISETSDTENDPKHLDYGKSVGFVQQNASYFLKVLKKIMFMRHTVTKP